ncbi:MAG: DUF2214 family protein [Cyclobacteriaceae bacterium]|nr:DUF2214 family protein [Cyclobacteriaceae bacterium]
MTIELLLRYIHFVSIFGIAGTLVSEHLLLKSEMTRGELGKVSRIDAAYGLAALTLLIAGLTLWLGGFGKPTEFYTQNWIFHLKLTCYIAIGLLSIYPTIFLSRIEKGTHLRKCKCQNYFFYCCDLSYYSFS